MRILGISGSLRRDSYNTKLLREAGRLLPPGAELVEFDRGERFGAGGDFGDGDELDFIEFGLVRLVLVRIALEVVGLRGEEVAGIECAVANELEQGPVQLV